MSEELGHFTVSDAERIARHIREFGDRRPAVHRRHRRRVIPSRLILAQAPEGGVPARSGATPGEASVDEVVRATESGIGYAAGDLVKTGRTFTAVNWTHSVLGDAGDRIIHVQGHFDGAYVLGADQCDNNGDPADIKTQQGG